MYIIELPNLKFTAKSYRKPRFLKLKKIKGEVLRVKNEANFELTNMNVCGPTCQFFALFNEQMSNGGYAN